MLKSVTKILTRWPWPAISRVALATANTHKASPAVGCWWRRTWGRSVPPSGSGNCRDWRSWRESGTYYIDIVCINIIYQTYNIKYIKHHYRAHKGDSKIPHWPFAQQGMILQHSLLYAENRFRNFEFWNLPQCPFDIWLQGQYFWCSPVWRCSTWEKLPAAWPPPQWTSRSACTPPCCLTCPSAPPSPESSAAPHTSWWSPWLSHTDTWRG